ncbi:MAG TPA: glycosyltransferase family 4 protein [Candidatus Methylomirabilis sp.]|nr:glycosyltransferase family 4 protein [Candidatus Methylomirabilis sp.]
MRLAVVSPFVDRRHGTERALAELLERLARDHACEIHLYAQRVEDLALTRGQTPPPAGGAIFWHKVPSIPGPHLLQFLAWMFFNGFLRKWHNSFRGMSYDLVLSPGVNCLHPDVVIVHALFHRLRELSQAENNPSFASPGLFRRWHRSLYYRLLTFLERKIYSDPKVSFSAVSQRTAGLLQKYFQRSDVRVIPNAVDTLHFSPSARLAKRMEARAYWGFREADFVLLLIGNDWYNKGLPTVLEALAALSDIPLRLLVVGTEDSRPFQSLATKLGVSSRCLWESPRADVLDFYAAADLYVSPSLEDSFGLPVAEAMACGLPAITSVFAGVAENASEGVDGFVLQDPRDARKLTTLIRQLAADTARRLNVGEAAAHKANEFTWDHAAASAWDLINYVVARKPASSGPR